MCGTILPVHPSPPVLLHGELLRNTQNFVLYLFILTANGVLPGGSGTTIRHITQTKQITQTIKDTLHTMNTMRIWWRKCV
jgi:hypothetical protein